MVLPRTVLLMLLLCEGDADCSCLNMSAKLIRLLWTFRHYRDNVWTHIYNERYTDLKISRILVVQHCKTRSLLVGQARVQTFSAVAARSCYRANPANVLKRDAPRSLSRNVLPYPRARLKKGIHIVERELNSVGFANHLHGSFHKSVNMDRTALHSNRFTNEQWPRHAWWSFDQIFFKSM